MRPHFARAFTLRRCTRVEQFNHNFGSGYFPLSMSKRQNFYFDKVKTSLIIIFELNWPTLITGLLAGMVFVFVVCCVPKVRIYNSMQFKIKVYNFVSVEIKLSC